MAGLVVNTGPASEPLTVAETKAYLRVSGSAEDTLIEAMIATARIFCEEYTGRALITQTLIMTVDATNEINDPLWEGTQTGPYINFYKDHLTLPKGNVQSVSSVKTYDDADNATTFSSDNYYVDSAREPARVVLRTGETWPTALRVANAVEVTYIAGYGDNASDVPAPLRMGMLQHIAYLYDQRGDMKDYLQTRSAPPMVVNLYAPYKIMHGLGGSPLMALG
jgi:hypothetical protein